MKKGLCNKLLTVLCALVLCMSIVPVTSFAEGTAVDVTTAEQLKEALSDGKTANVTAQIEINEDMALENGNITLSGKNTIVVKANVAFNNINITANNDAGYAPITVSADGITVSADGLKVVQNCAATGASYATSAQSMQIAEEPGNANAASPQNIQLNLKNSELTTASVNSRGITFANSSDNSKLVLDNTKVTCGDYQNEWKGERGIALWNQCDIDIDIINNSEIGGYKYGINAGHASGILTERIDVEVNHSTISGWSGFNIWSSNGIFKILNNSVIRGFNGSFNGDKIYTFSSIVINDDLYGFGSGPALQNQIIIEDSTIEAITRDGQPTQELIRVDNADNTLLSIKGNTKLVKDVGTSENGWPIALNNTAMSDKAGMDDFILNHMEVEDTVELIGAKLFAYSFGNEEETKYILVKASADDESAGTVTSDIVKNKLIAAGSVVNVEAQAKEGYYFDGWYFKDQLLSKDAKAAITIPDTLDNTDDFAGIYEITAKFNEVKVEPEVPTVDPSQPVEEVTAGVSGEDAAQVISDASLAAINSILAGNSVEGIDSQKVLEAIDNGNAIATEIVIENLADAEVSDEDAKAIDSVLGGAEKIAQYFDISVILKDGENELGTLSELGREIEFTIVVPEELKSVANRLYVVRVHDGKADKLDTKLNEDGTLTFKTDKFSTYALVEGHEHSYTWTSDGDKTHTGTCSCGITVTKPHTWDEGKVTLEPTKDKEGVKTYTCTVCAETKTETIAKLSSGSDDAPKTGDEANLFVWAAVLMCGAALAVLLVAFKRRCK